MTAPSPADGIACRRIVFLVSQLGYDGRLLYWEPILERLARRLPGLRVLCGDAAAVANYPHLPFAPAFRRLQFSLPGVSAGQFRRVFSLPAPGVIGTVLRMRPQVLVLMEFGFTTLFGLVAARLLSGCALLLLVESDPGPLEASLLGWRRRLRRLVCRQCDLILTNNAKGRRYLEERLAVPAIRIVQAPYLVPRVPAMVAPATVDGCGPAGTGPCTFVFVGRLIPSKGVDLLLRAVARAVADHGADCRLVIVGDGPERVALEALCDDLGLRPRVDFAGWIEYARLAAYYQSSDVFVFPTLQDYRSLASFEALAFALPLMVSQYDGACGEVVVEGENGFVFDPRDGTAFAEKLAWLAKHPEARQAFRARSRAVGESFSLDRAVDAFVAAIAGAVDRGPR